MIYLITGATGLIGQQIIKRCEEQHIVVHYLTTSRSKIKTTNTCKGFYWNPKSNDIDIGAFEGVSTIIHLAGANIAKRWTKSYKKEIIESRTKTTNLLKETLEKIQHTITHFISASGISIYKNSLTEFYDEDSVALGDNFIAQVVQKWEASVDSLSELNINVAKIRIGLVLDKKQGALPKITKPVKMYIGAAFGKGTQWQSWIHIKDLTSIFMYISQNKLTGVYNAVSPNSVSQNKFIKSCGEILSKPIWLPNIPKLVLKLFLGEMSTILIDSQRVSSSKIEEKGFLFEFPSLRKALQFLYSRS